MIAAFGMYDPPWLHGANDRLWQALAARLAQAEIGHVPAALSRDRPLDAIWTAPDLMLAQTCGYPLMTELGDAVTVVATPVHAAPGCDGGWHRSALVVRRDDPAQGVPGLAGRCAAINARNSNTGMNLLRATVAPFAHSQRFFGRVIETGAHRRSISAVVAGHADVAAIDAVTWALMCDHFKGLSQRLRVLGWSPPSPALPLITAAGASPTMLYTLRQALTHVFADPALADARAALRWQGIMVLPAGAYDAVMAIEESALDAGYPVLA